MLFTNAHRAPVLLACAGILGGIVAPPASAQSDDRGVLEGMRACARIDDAAQRTACYDRYLRPTPAPATAPPGTTPAIPPPPVASAPISSRRADRPRPPLPARYTGEVSAVAQRGPGIFLLTMKDGAQWQFASSVRASYDPPSAGSMVEIRPGALGSFLLSYDDQSAVRVIRVR